MQKLLGTPVNELVTMGKIFVLGNSRLIPEKKLIENTEEELSHLQESIDVAAGQLLALYEETKKAKGEEVAAIIEMQQLLLMDEGFLQKIRSMIAEEKVCAAYAAYMAGEAYAQMFAAMDDAYMQARGADLQDIAARIVRILLGVQEQNFAEEKAILVAEDLGPSETVRLNKDKVLAFVTQKGSVNSHTAILARTMNIPALVNVQIEPGQLENGTEAIVDGKNGFFLLEPDEAAKEQAREAIEEQSREYASLQALKDLPAQTKDGRVVKLYANIGQVEDAEVALAKGCEGIGLFRSEFLFLGKDAAPTEEEQFLAYKAVLEQMGSREVVVRTLDIGADKQADYLHMPAEENPAMGLRAIRLCLTNQDLFKVQLRALFRAACFGNLLIMYPMIISEKELDAIGEVVDAVCAELAAEGVAYKVPPQGIMIETPAAVMLSERLAKRVAFFSIGTNDLTQYTLAIDRQNQSLSAFYDAHHPAVLAMIKMVVDNAHKAGIWTGICGELAADESLTEEFVQMGIDELSVSAGALLRVKKAVREI